MPTLQGLIILQMHTTGRNVSEISGELNINVPKVKKNPSVRNSLIEYKNPTIGRRHLEFADKLRVILCSESGAIRNDICKEFYIAPPTYRQIMSDKVQLRQDA